MSSKKLRRGFNDCASERWRRFAVVTFDLDRIFEL